MVVFLNAQASGNGNGLFLSEYNGAGVTLLLGIIPVIVITLVGPVNLALLQLGFLQADDVGIDRIEKVHEALLHAGPQTIYIP